MAKSKHNRQLNRLIVPLLAVVCYCSPYAQCTPAFAQATVLTGMASSVPKNAEILTNVVNIKNGDGRLSAPVHPHYVGQFHPQRSLIRTVYVRDNSTFFQRHPKVKAASIGAGVGLGAGALTGLVTGRGMVRGALIGGGTGAGVGLVRSSDTLRRHPIVRDVATGSLVGLGLGAAGSRYHRTVFEATGLGAVLGLGVGMFKNLR